MSAQSCWTLALTAVAALLPACSCAGNDAQCCCCLQSANKWQSWAQTLGPVQISADAKFSDIIVPTKDSARYTFLLHIALKHGHPILFVGPTGQRPCQSPSSCSSQLCLSGPLDTAIDELHGSLTNQTKLMLHRVIITSSLPMLAKLMWNICLHSARAGCLQLVSL